MIPQPEENTHRNEDGSIHCRVRIGVGTGTAWVDLRPGEPGYQDFDAFLAHGQDDKAAQAKRGLAKARLTALAADRVTVELAGPHGYSHGWVKAGEDVTAHGAKLPKGAKHTVGAKVSTPDGKAGTVHSAEQNTVTVKGAGGKTSTYTNDAVRVHALPKGAAHAVGMKVHTPDGDGTVVSAEQNTVRVKIGNGRAQNYTNDAVKPRTTAK